jgi:hypothetical protein
MSARRGSLLADNAIKVLRAHSEENAAKTLIVLSFVSCCCRRIYDGKPVGVVQQFARATSICAQSAGNCGLEGQFESRLPLPPIGKWITKSFWPGRELNFRRNRVI